MYLGCFAIEQPMPVDMRMVPHLCFQLIYTKLYYGSVQQLISQGRITARTHFVSSPEDENDSLYIHTECYLDSSVWVHSTNMIIT